MNTAQILRHRVNMATGREPADVCLRNVRVVDVFCGRVTEPRTVRMGGGAFLGFEPGPALEDVDAQGAYLLPGLIDSHVHIESSMLCPPQFARMVVPLGTTTVIADPHEIANVLGVQGIRYMLESSADLPLDVRIMLPSCVPATPFEHAGAVLTAADLAPFMGEARVGGLGEMMHFTGVLHTEADVMDKLALALDAGKVVDGHAPSLRTLMGAAALDGYAAAGISTDHECHTVDGMLARLERGMYVAIRQGSAARNLPELIRGVTPTNAHRCLLCTDDRHPGDILKSGHINYLLRLAVDYGVDPILAIRMATLNPAQCFGLRRKGGIAPGFDADAVLVKDLRHFRVLQVYARGRKVAENGQMCVDIRVDTPAGVTSAVRPAPLTPQVLRLPVPSGRARVIGVQAHSLVSTALERTVHTVNGCFNATTNPGLTKVAVIERHKGTGHVGLGLLAGYAMPDTMLGGAIATTIAHDSHNIVVAGDSDADMLTAVEDLQRMGGGITLVRGGTVLDHLALPVAGLMSDRDAAAVHADLCRVLDTAQRELHVAPGVEPFMTLSFMALAVIPELKLTDQGLFDVRTSSFVPVAID